MSKEAYTSVKKGLYSCQKRPVLVSKEAYTSVKRGLYSCQKRPILVSKHTDLAHVEAISPQGVRAEEL